MEAGGLDQHNSRRHCSVVRHMLLRDGDWAHFWGAPTYAAGTKNSVYFSNVKDGDTVPHKFTYKMKSPAAPRLPPMGSRKGRAITT